MKKICCAGLLAALMLLSGCAATEEAEPDISSVYGSLYGSARHISGRTIILSIFANDPTTKWDFSSDIDCETQSQTRQYLKTAADWITEQVSAYDVDAEIICDWKKHHDLIYTANFDTELEKDDQTYTAYVYTAQKEFIADIDADALLQKYDADNIIYMFFINSDFTNQAHSVTSPRAYLYGDEYYTEHINLCVRQDDIYTAPSSYAHEILHCFGAYDLYYENQVITKEYVDHCAEEGTYDIMYYVTSGEKIYSEFTELDAYYIGITDYSKEVKEWELGPSDYQ